jgi:hypothetical protein
MNEMSGRSPKKGYRIHRNHIKESTRGYFTIPNWMIPVSSPFCPGTFCGLRIDHTQQVGSLGWGLIGARFGGERLGKTFQRLGTLVPVD